MIFRLRWPATSGPARCAGCGRTPRRPTRRCSGPGSGWTGATTCAWPRRCCAAGTAGRARPAPWRAACARLRGAAPPTGAPGQRPAGGGPAGGPVRAGRPGSGRGQRHARRRWWRRTPASCAGSRPTRTRPGSALLAAVESAGGLVGRRDAGPRACPGGPTCTTRCWPACSARGRLPGCSPPRLAELASQISAAFGGRPVNPDSPAQLCRRSRPTGSGSPSTRPGVLRDIDHPAVPLLLEYKELARLHTANGWAWLDEWVPAAGSARSTWSAGWSPAAGRPAAAARCRSPGCCAARWWPTRAGCWWWPTRRSSSRGCWPRWPATTRSPRRPARRPVPGAGRRVRRRPGQGQGRPAVRHVRRRGRRGVAAARRAAAPVPAAATSTWRPRPGRARRAGWSGPGSAGPARRRPPSGAG